MSSKWVSYVVGLLFFGLQVIAQQKQLPAAPDAIEIYNLLEVLRVPQKTSITTTTEPLPRRAAYKVYLASRFDMVLEKALQNCLGKWNEKQGQKFGQLQWVDDLKQADLVLANFQDVMETVTETVVVGAQLTTRHPTGTTRATTMLAPLYSYLLVPQADGFAIIWQERKLVRKKALTNRGAVAKLCGALATQLTRKR